MGWISVDEGLPCHLVPVLVYFDGSVGIATYDVEDELFVQDTGQAKLYGSEPLDPVECSVEFWMPLRIPPLPSE